MTCLAQQKQLSALRKRRNSGFVLLEMMIAVSIAGLMMIMYYWHLQTENQKAQVTELAKNIVQYTQAVSEYITDYPAKLSATGISWLMNAHKPQTTKSYLPENFTLNSSLWSYVDNNITTNFSNTDHFEAEIQVDGFSTPLLGAMVDKAAKDLSAKESSQFSYTYSPQSAQITIRFIANISSTDAGSWLSIYGKNSMEANLNFDNSTLDGAHQINNVNTVNFTANHSPVGYMRAFSSELDINSPGKQVNIGADANKVFLGKSNSTNVYANDIYLNSLNGETISQAIHDKEKGDAVIKAFSLDYNYNPLHDMFSSVIYDLDLNGCYVPPSDTYQPYPHFVVDEEITGASYVDFYDEVKNTLQITIKLSNKVVIPYSGPLAMVYVFCVKSAEVVNGQKIPN